MLLAILLALVAAAGNATATICQRLGVEQSAHEQGSTLSLIRGVFHRPIWFLGFFVMTLAFGLQALALSVGTLSSVQPVMVTEIVFLVVIIGTWFHGQLTWREWLGSVGTAAALGAFLALSAPVGGTTQPSAESWLLLVIASGGAVVVVLVASRRGSRVWRAATFGIAAAICYALDRGVREIGRRRVVERRRPAAAPSGPLRRDRGGGNRTRTWSTGARRRSCSGIAVGAADRQSDRQHRHGHVALRRPLASEHPTPRRSGARARAHVRRALRACHLAAHHLDGHGRGALA